jgi:endonuclease/exonuclease/phosphatase family metal-dependent hydrolase
MRIATFNLESLDRIPGSARLLETRLDMLRPSLERLDADILCLQEVNGQRTKGHEERSLEILDRLTAETPYASFDRAVTSGPHGAGVADIHNLVTLSRWPIIERRELRHTLFPPLSYRMSTAIPPASGSINVTFDRAVLLSAIRLGSGKVMTVLNVHLRAPLATPIPGQKEAAFVWKSVSGWAEGFFLSGLKRSAQALETRMEIDRLMNEDADSMIVVAGDFNAVDHETPLRILVGAEEDTGNGLLGPRSLAILDRSLPADRRFSVMHHGRPEMLDHILCSHSVLAHFRGLEAHNEMLTDEIVGYGKTAHPSASYHAPLVAEISI